MTIQAAFGSPRRESSYPALNAPEGRVVWQLDLPCLNGEPISVLIPWRTDTLVVSATHLALVAGPHLGHRTPDAPGVLIWSRRKAHGTPVVVADDAAHFLDPELRLVSCDRDQSPVREPHRRFPGLSAMSDVSLLLPRDDEVAAVVQYVGQLHGDAPHADTLCVRDDAPLSDWGLRSPGIVRPPALAFADRGRMYWRTDPSGDVVLADLERRMIGASFQLPLDTVIEWSASARGRVYAVGSLGGQPTALAFTGLGEELWRWSDPAIVERWSSACPPAVSDEGRVLFFGESEVVALRRGGVQWWGRVPGRGTLRGAILSDGASLVVRGSVLHHFDPSGNAVFEVDLKEDVIAGPVVTPNGWVNLATGSGLLGVC